MKAWWLKRTPRERVIVAAGGAVIAVLACLQLVLSPLMAWRADAGRRAETAQSEYRIVHRSAALAQPAKPASGDNTPIRNVLTELAGQFGVSLTFVNALADGSVDIQGGPVPPDDVFRFLSALETQHGVKVVAADIVRAADDPEKVRIQATLSR